MAFGISQTNKMALNDIALTEAIKHIQENIQQTPPNLNDDINNLFEIICELQLENEALKAELTIAKGAGKAGKAELRKSMASKFKIFIKHFSAKRGEQIRAEEEKDLIESINKVVDRVVPLPKIRK